jgi:hypothetical protein
MVFPWAERPAPSGPPDILTSLETLLRRLPRTIRQLRDRHGSRPPFRVQDEHDLDDLLRAVLPLQFDEVRLESRTPSYSPGNRSDLRLGLGEGNSPVALTAKLISGKIETGKLEGQWAEDLAYYGRVSACRTLVGFVYDPQGLLRDPQKLEAVWSQTPGNLQLRCVIAS